jgi:protein-disulfide isomerase
MPRLRLKLVDLFTAAILVATSVLIADIMLERNSQLLGHGPEPDRDVEAWDSLTSRGLWKGPREAEILFVVFSDYQCPACRRLAPRLNALMERFPGRLAVVYRHWPLKYHRSAYAAARAAECAGEQGKLEPFHDELFESSEWLEGVSEEGFRKIATDLMIEDIEGFSRCTEVSTPHPWIEQDIAAANAFGARGTPALVVNGRYLGSIPDSVWLDNLLLQGSFPSGDSG